MDSQKPNGSGLPSTDTGAAAKPAADAGTDADLRPELRPVAARFGREMVDFCLRLAGANMALDYLLAYGQTHSKIRPQTAVLLDSMGWSFNQLAAARGWEWDMVLECLADIGRASRLANPEGSA